MARPIWTGSITFGLVSVPVGLYAATEDRTIHFHQVVRGKADRVRHKRVNERTGREVDWSDIVKGYQLRGGKYVTLEPEELEQIAPGRSRSIEVSGFVDLADIDPIYYERTYYLLPARDDEGKAYALLREAMHKTGKAAVATLVMRDKQHLATVRAEGRALLLETMHFADEIRDPAEQVDNLPERRGGRRAEMDQAVQLIEAMAMPWRPRAYHDTYREKVEELIEAKRRGREIEAAEPPPEPTNVVDLTEVLERSIAEARRGRRTRKPARKTSAKRAPAKKGSAKKSSARRRKAS